MRDWWQLQHVQVCNVLLSRRHIKSISLPADVTSCASYCPLQWNGIKLEVSRSGSSVPTQSPSQSQRLKKSWLAHFWFGVSLWTDVAIETTDTGLSVPVHERSIFASSNLYWLSHKNWSRHRQLYVLFIDWRAHMRLLRCRSVGADVFAKPVSL